MYSSFVNNLECQAPPAGMRAPGSGSLGLRTTRALGISLKDEVKAMKLEVVAMDRSFKMMKVRLDHSPSLFILSLVRNGQNRPRST